MTGVRNGVMNTLGPNLSRLVRAATAAIAVIGSGIGSGEDSRSENHSESISLFSQSSTNCQKNSRPAGPLGHGPGITPMRYLMRINATLARHPCAEPSGGSPPDQRSRSPHDGDERGGQRENRAGDARIVVRALVRERH